MGIMQCPKHGPGPIISICPECECEITYYAAKEAGQPLPFVGYEHTLDWRNLPTIRKLKEFLRAHYPFQKSRYPFSISGHPDSLVIIPGMFTEPLTISIYYVIDAGEQEKLLALIQDFFSKSEHPQRKIQFFEEERWYEEVRATSRSYGQLEAMLLREETVV